MRTFMFPGQGSQVCGMGAALFDEFAELTARADEILGYSIKSLCTEDPRNEINSTLFTQPAIYVVNALSHLKRTRDSGVEPDYLAGHSLGEVNALLAAGCFDFETGLRLVRRRAEVMSKSGNGAMAAILNAGKDQVQSLLQQHGLDGIDLANYNTPSQIVISGPREQIAKAQYAFTGAMVYCPLNTSGAFHSRLMHEARREFEQYLAELAISDPRIPVMSNVTARPYERGRVAQTLAEQISSPVRWCEEIQYLLRLGAAEPDGMQFEEIGHGEVLTRLLAAIKQQTPVEGRSGTGGRRMPAGDKVQAWNGRHPVGTRVKCASGDYGELETVTPAMVLFGHRAAVYMKGYEGYFDLEEITPLVPDALGA